MIPRRKEWFCDPDYAWPDDLVKHPALIDGQRQTTTLNEYAQHFPTVEIDTFFYALPKSATVQKWLTEVPRDFQFIVKAHRLMTQHENLTEQDSSLAEVFQNIVMPSCH